ncbi:hypothetical protein Daesc_010254 [Daldinia eschscholtzii]|uniref:Uncharacterized protein n=1 Tax=Daldinia eschscholtzii TaxID=292717 RepID=A0AAX6M7X7_9PEZI
MNIAILGDLKTFVSFVPKVCNIRELLLSLPTSTKLSNSLEGDTLSLSDFFLIQNKGPPIESGPDELVSVRNQELAEKPVFITMEGLVGIATAPIELGDSLSRIQGSPIYLILRGIKEGDGGLGNASQDRIVARAAVNEKLVHNITDMREPIDSTPSRRFQII